MSAADFTATAVGVALILIVVREVFHTLLHPGGVAAFSQSLFRATRRLSRYSAMPSGAIAAPLGFVSVAATWATLMTVGWALVYWPHLPDSFAFTNQLAAPTQDGFFDALYISIVTLTTVGFGDVAPQGTALRMAAGLEAALGFALLTATISWILSMYPALVRRRTLAARLSPMLEGSGDGVRLAPGRPPVALAVALDSVAEQLNMIEVDLVQFPSTYFFLPPARDLSLAMKLPELREAIRRDDLPREATASAAATDAALDRIARTLAAGPYGLGANPSDPLRAYASEEERAMGRAAE